MKQLRHFLLLATMLTTGVSIYALDIYPAGFKRANPPRITSFSPQMAGLNDTVTITGTNLNYASVELGDARSFAFILSRTSTTMQIVVQEGSSGNVYVSNADGEDSLPGFKYIPTAPRVTSYSPKLVSSGAVVTIKGKYLKDVTGIMLGGNAVDSIISVQDTQLVAIAGKPGSGDVTVTTTAGNGAISGFTCLPAGPQITGIAPSRGPVGTIVTIYGHHFHPVANKNTVYFGAAQAKVLAVTESTLTVNVPVGASYESLSVTTNKATATSPVAFDVTFAGGPITSSSFAAGYTYRPAQPPFELLALDMNNDQRVDLVAPYATPTQLQVVNTVIKNLGNETFAAVENRVLTATLDQTETGWADMDGDGRKDLVLTVNSDGKAVTVIRNISTRDSIAFAQHQSAPLTSLYSNRVSTGDLDVDGRPDVLVQSQSVSVGRIGLNVTVDSILLLTPVSPSLTGGESAIIEDLDGDGKNDLLVLDPYYGGLLFYRNILQLKGVVSMAARQQIKYLAKRILVADIDGDQLPDIITVNKNGYFGILKNNSVPGNISFGNPVEFAIGYIPARIGIGDLDGDGKPDLAFPGGTSSVISVFKNLSDKNQIAFGTAINYPAPHQPTLITIADLNNDSKPDIASAGAGGISLYYNRINAADNPVIDAFSPESARKTDMIRITGSHFTGAIQVTFGGVPAQSFQVQNDSTITAVVGEGAGGLITVITPAGIGSKADFLFIADKPAITSFTPTQATVRTPVTIRGSHFTDVTQVLLGGVNSPFTIISDSIITVVAGAGATGYVTVASNGGADSSAGFTYKPPVPMITRFYPSTATIGDTVMINGNYFDFITHVTFGGSDAGQFKVQSDTAIMAVVGRGSSGKVSVSSATADAELPGFSFRIPVPVTTAYMPQTGREGDTIRISGRYFQWVTGVSLGGVPVATYQVYGDTLIVAVVGKGASGYVNLKTDERGYDMYNLRQFAFVYPAPKISAFTPTTAKPGTTVTITGNNFRNIMAVKFGGVKATSWNVISDTKITAVVGTGAIGAVTVDSDWGVDSLQGFNWITDAPIILSFTPDTAWQSRTVTIKGLNLSKTYAVLFGALHARSFKVISDTVVEAVVGEGNSGSVVLLVSGFPLVGKAGFTYVLPPPIITSFSPTSATAGTTVTIRGTNFTGAHTVKFGSESAMSFKVIADTLITAIVAHGSSGAITIQTDKGNGAASGFIFTDQPAILNFYPSSGGFGDLVTITGHRLSGSSNVSFGGIAVQRFTIVNDTTITAVLGRGRSGNVEVSTPAGVLSMPGFAYVAPAPVITGFSPATGTLNSQLTIHGINFTDAYYVAFNTASSLNFSVVNDSTIIATVGFGESGEVRVINSKGEGKKAGFIFTQPPPAISHFEPAAAAMGDTVTIYGSFFKSVTAVAFGGTNAAGFSVITDSLITAIVSKGSSGAVTVVTPSLPYASLSGFTFLSPLEDPAKKIAIYPNPAVRYTWVTHPIANNAKIYLLNAGGDIVRVVATTPGTTQTRMMLTGIKAGMYYLSWRDGTQSISAAIIVSP
ncbi:Por secretion system C-terminal sorting domain-containing protein [Chitinophaga jiangningensis]|uniref:Por secretion system C-terminal sorting domain-containing protein n=1 Tax=Chitinophaga jiangningensis TaxID=1419482 RepID=A0A1M7J0K1_9BACT|nr:IPT/TIG domain-containing protein [Chitinophaga jiangningensis]SHM46600.1 Por secretion system C-terminal sorting domain-containing protein [Chitinophaga jiangningensis]